MTVCDECGVNVHIYCLNPILSKVPEDLWYCDECKEVGYDFIRIL